MKNDIFIDVRSARAYVSRKRGDDHSPAARWTHEPAANWQRLERLAADAVREAGGAITLPGIYPCPAWIADLALWPEDVLALVTTPAEAEREFGLGPDTARKAARRGDLRSRRAGSTILVYRPDAEERWGVHNGLDER